MSNQQPRNPRDLPGLLRFAMEATRNEDAPAESRYREMSPERRRFLEEAIRSLTYDVVENLTKAMNVLIEGNATEEEQVSALEIVTDFVENIDTANDFFKIGGFCIILQCLNSPHAEVRQGTSELVAALAQNNPFCQKHLLELDVLPKLFELLTDAEAGVAPAALSAISSMARGEETCVEFFKLGGVECLLGTLDTGNERLIRKTAFLMSALCRQDEKAREEFVALGAVEKLAVHLHPHTDYDALLESALSALFTLLESQKAICRCQNVDGLLAKLEAIKKTSDDKDEFQEIIGYVDGIIEKCFKETGTPER